VDRGWIAALKEQDSRIASLVASKES